MFKVRFLLLRSLYISIRERYVGEKLVNNVINVMEVSEIRCWG